VLDERQSVTRHRCLFHFEQSYPDVATSRNYLIFNDQQGTQNQVAVAYRRQYSTLLGIFALDLSFLKAFINFLGRPQLAENI
jgi:hypothetical protein